MPFVLLAYWFWVGSQFAKVLKSPLIAISAGHFFGIISLLLYYWQFVFIADGKRIFLLAGMSQMYTAPLSFITVRAGRIFESTQHTVTQISLLAAQLIGLIIMVLIFSIGYFYSKRENSK